MDSGFDGSANVTDGRHAQFDAKDALEIGGGTVAVGDNGVVTLIGPDGKPDKTSGKSKFTRFKPAARRAATVLFVAIMSKTIHPVVTTPGATAAKK